MQLAIVLRKEVADEVEAQGIFEFVCDKLAAHPSVTITASVSEKLELEEPEPE